MINTELLDANGVPEEYYEAMYRINELPGCKYVTALPDAGMSNHETPYGIAAGFDEYVVPQLLGRIIGCGMGLIKLDITREEINTIGNKFFIRHISEFINKNKSRYLITSKLLNDLYIEGPDAILQLEPRLKGHIDNHQLQSLNLSPFLYELQDLEKIVPHRILNSKKILSMPGQSITKNHFIEFSDLKEVNNGNIQNIDEDNGNIFCSFHLESRLSGSVNRYYSGTRKKERDNGAFTNPLTYFGYLQKSLFHVYAEGLFNLSGAWKYFLRNLNFTPIPINSIHGQRYLSSILLQTNLERVSRLLFSVVIIDGIEEILGDKIDWNLEFESSHNTFETDDCFGEELLVSRKNLVRADNSKVGYMSGMYNLPSFLLKPKNVPKSPRWANSYDHGIGNHLWRGASSDSFSKIKKESGSKGDNSNFEYMWEKAGATNSSQNNEEEIDVCDVYRVDLKNGLINCIPYNIQTGAVTDHVLTIYSEPDCPVSVTGLLYPFLNYKEKRG